MLLMQQPGRKDIWKQLKTHVNSTHAPPLAADETAKAPVEAIDDETLVELTDDEPLPAEDEPLPAEDDDALPAELDPIPLDPDGVPEPLTADVSPPAPPPPAVVSRVSSLP